LSAHVTLLGCQCVLKGAGLNGGKVRHRPQVNDLGGPSLLKSELHSGLRFA
jgi:hypothetical protein